MPPPVVLSIAGFDPSSGAGVTADIKTLAALGCYGITCITALTVQSTAGVTGLHPIEAEVVSETLRELAGDFSIAAIRIGMLGSAEVVEAVADFLSGEPSPHVVLDPVLKSSSGANLLAPDALRTLADTLLPLCSVVTPNVDEAQVLTGIAVKGLPAMVESARALHRMGAPGVVVTGGHLDPPVDLLSHFDGETVRQIEMPGKHVASRSTHGTGCAFATALAAYLAQGRSLADAATGAKEYVTGAIAAAESLGRGTGPINHFWNVPPGTRRR